MKPSLQKSISVIVLLFLIYFSPLLAQNDTLRADDYYYDGKDLFYAGKYEAARQSYQEALKLYQKLYGEEHKKLMKVYYQMGRLEQTDLNYSISLEYLQKSIDLAEKLFGYYSEDVGYGLQAIGNTYDNMVNAKLSIEYYYKSIEVFKKVYGIPSLEVGGAYMNIGISELDQGMYNNAERNFQRALAIFKESSEPNGKAFNKIYLSMSYLYRQTGDYEKAIIYGQRALNVKLMNYDELHPSVAKYYGHIGKTYEAQEDYTAALPYLQKNLELSIKSIGKDHPDTGACHSDVGQCLVSMGQYEKGMDHYRQAIRVFEKRGDDSNPLIIDLYKNIGHAYEIGFEDYDKALSVYQEALDKALGRDFLHNKSLAILKRRIGTVFFKKGNIDLALRTLQEGMSFLAPDFKLKTTEWYSNPSVDQTQELLELLQILTLKADFLEGRYQANKDIKDLKAALQCSERAIEAIEKMRRSYLSESSRQFLNTKTSAIYENAVTQAFALYYLTSDPAFIQTAFRLSQKSKASILWQTMNERYAFEASGIPRAELDSIYALHQRIESLEEQLSEVASVNKETEKIDQQLFDLKAIYEKRIKKLEKEYPKYYQLKYAQSAIDFSDLQSNLKNKETALLDYFYTDESVFIFVLTKDNLVGIKQKLPFDLSSKIKQIREVDVTHLISAKNNTVGYFDAVNDLYALLIHPVSNQLLDKQQLVIIPYGVLQLLSFDLLAPATDNKDFRSTDYLLRKYNIQYTWSAAIWANRPEVQTTLQNNYAGFAPGFGVEKTKAIAEARPFVFRNGLLPLTHSIEEVNFANTFFPGQVFTDSAASETQFLATAPQSKIIHLATHALADDQFPLQSSLLFSTNSDDTSDGFLTAAEIYNLSIPADLAVMSACNTGFGQLTKGDGVMSLGRAFMYAGCKSIVMSLWLANDESTSSIMQSFYKYAADGKTKDEALRLAKLDYLEGADALTAHPYFWANLVAVGDMEPLKEKRGGWLWWGLAIVIGFVGILLWRR